MALLDPVLNPLFGPLINLSPFWALAIIAFFISLIITVVYKFVTDQSVMKELKQKQKDFQQRMKDLRDKPEEMMRVQKEAMEVNMEYMKHSFKPTFVTIIPMIFIFGWLASTFAVEPIFPGESYTVTAQFAQGVVQEATLITSEVTQLVSESATVPVVDNQAKWTLRSSEVGNHPISVEIAQGVSVSRDVVISQEIQPVEATVLFENSDIESITVEYDKLRPAGSFSLFGWKPTWLGWYVMFSLLFSMSLRKFMKLH